jgi:hypothetical protein
MRRLLIIISLVAVVSSAPIAHAKEKRDPKERAAKINALIEKLVLVELPAGTSTEAKYAHNREMLKVWMALSDFGVEAFPAAIDHLQDKRTSFTEDSGSTDETWTVGRACFDVLYCNLEPYNWGMYSSSIPPEKYWWRPQYCNEFLNTPKKAREWLAAHKSKPLVDLQIEVLEWVTTHRSERKVEISAEDRQKLLDRLVTLKKTRKPLEPAVPWSK